MAAQWDMSDDYLQQMLQAFVTYLASISDRTIHLYKNDPTLSPGITVGAFNEADFPGYASQNIPAASWGSATVTSHVASSTSSNTNLFVGSTGTWSPQTIYGYYVLDSGGNYYYAERFSSPIDMSPDGQISVVPRVLHQTLPWS